MEASVEAPVEAPAEPDPLVDAVAPGYAFEGAALELGGLMRNATELTDTHIRIPLGMLNRHGLVAGATGTGKTKTLQLMAEQLSANGVPVFAADIKGDLSGMSVPGEGGEKIASRAASVGQTWTATAYPVEFYALGGQGTGVPMRVTMTAFGPVLLSKVLGLNDTQESSLGLVFHYADQKGLPLLDLSDLRAVVSWLTSDEGKADLKELGGLSAATAGVILRELIGFQDQGADAFFGEPEFESSEFLQTTPGRSRAGEPGRAAEPAGPPGRLLDVPDVAARRPVPRPARGRRHRQAQAGVLLRRGAPALQRRVEGLPRPDRPDRAADPLQGRRRLLRDAVSPTDVPDVVLAQLGSRIQHQLRAHTPNDAKALKATVNTYPNSAYDDLGEVITSLGIGEAVVTVMNERGAPTPVAWTRLRAPESLMGTADAASMEAAVKASPRYAKYAAVVDRDSAREMLAVKVEEGARRQAEEEAAEEREKAAKTASKTSSSPSYVGRRRRTTAASSPTS